MHVIYVPFLYLVSGSKNIGLSLVSLLYTVELCDFSLFSGGKNFGLLMCIDSSALLHFSLIFYIFDNISSSFSLQFYYFTRLPQPLVALCLIPIDVSFLQSMKVWFLFVVTFLEYLLHSLILFSWSLILSAEIITWPKNISHPFGVIFNRFFFVCFKKIGYFGENGDYHVGRFV